jgi:hypothetical protein
MDRFTCIRQMKFGTWKIMGMRTSFIWIKILFDEPFKYGDGAESEVTLGQTLNHMYTIL